MRLNCFLNLPAGPPPRLHSARATSFHLSLFGLIGSDCASEFVGRSVELIPSLLLQSRLKFPSSTRVPHDTGGFLFNQSTCSGSFAESFVAVLWSTGLLEALE